MKLRLGTKITLGTMCSMIAASIGGLLIQNHMLYREGRDLIHDSMRCILKEAETTRETMATLQKKGAFNQVALLEELKTHSDFRESTIYQTVPVVAAWQSVEKLAKEEGFEFRTPSRSPRNKKNAPTPAEEKILASLESSDLDEYFEVERSTGKLIYARPIRLTSDCLMCHGDPAKSPTGDRKDIFGFEMENWKVGDMHGAVVLISDPKKVSEAVMDGTGWATVMMIPLAIVLGIISWFLNERMIMKPLSQAIGEIDSASQQTAGASGEVSNASQSLAEGATRQAAALEETSAALEELSSMTQVNADHAETAKKITGETRAVAESGSHEMEGMRKAMDEIKASSDEISKIIKNIDEIAFQTNILALNAAVEAARAGEAGLGFAVVADEVRNLAQRCAQAAHETADKIEESIQRSSRGVEISKRAVDVFSEIVKGTRKVDEVVSQIAGASREQTQGISQINAAVSDLDKTVQANAASSEETAAAANELSAQSMALKDAVTSLSVLVGSIPAALAQSPTTSRASSELRLPGPR